MIIMTRVLIRAMSFCFASLFSFFLQAQDEIILSKSYQDEPIIGVLNSIQEDYSIRIFYDPNWLSTKTISSESNNISLLDFLNKNIQQDGLKAVSYYGNIVLLADNPILLEVRSQDDLDVMLVGDENLPLNTIVSITGNVIDGTNSDPLIGARVYIKSLNIGSVTDLNGTYKFKIPVGKYKIEYSSIGYESKPLDVLIKSGGNLDIELFKGSIKLEELIISVDAQDANVNQRISGLLNMNAETIKQLPSFMGEVDPVRSLATLPGIATTGELSSGFNVRGGETGQNLIIQDGSIIYNPTHLFGFYSAFNSDMIDEINLFKGGGPANYGGRISSVLDVRLRNGDDEEYKVNGGIGLVSSRITAEGPIVKNKASFLIGGRTSYTNWLLHSFKNIELNNSAADFYDMNAKFLYRFSEKDFMTGSFYRSHDDFNLANEAIYDWGTTNFGIEWSHIFSDKTLSSFTLSSSNYNVRSTNEEDPLNGFIFENGIKNLLAKFEFIYKIHPKNSLLMGIEYNNATIEPGNLVPTKTSIKNTVNITDQHGSGFDFFIQDEWDVGSRLAVSGGLRLSNFIRRGPDKIYSFQENENNLRQPEVADSTFYDKKDIIKYFFGLEPRLSLRYLLSSSASFKFSYYRTYQYLHLISNTTSATPQDYYMASGPRLKPQHADQFSVGYFKNIRENKFEVSSEFYYKNMFNTVDFIEGADILGNEQLEGSLIQGKGRAYGLELQVKKNVGRFNGWISYTYSRSLKKMDGQFNYQRINNGDYYNSNFDKPHDLSIVGNFLMGGRLVFSANFSYNTGRPITVPIAKFSYDKTLAALQYSDRNAFRIPNYHRLDLSLTLKQSPKKTRLIKGEWVLSILNVYGRKNAYSIYFIDSGQARKLTILGSVFPSVTYNFKFGQ
ncbi:MAG: hypothetical protein ACI8Q1_002425 [Parvicella sp.]|jgi:hypothetical protein